MNLLPSILKQWKEFSPIRELKSGKRGPIYRLLYEVLKSNIEKGDLPSGYYLPSSRLLATEADLSRSTVNRAYELLIFDGLVVAEQGRGYLIDNQMDLNLKKQEVIKELDPNLSHLAQSFLEVSRTALPQKNGIEKSGLAFRPGVPPVDLFPVRRWMMLTQKYWKEIEYSSLDYKSTSGVQSLKETLVNYLRIDRNIECHPDQILVVSGSLQSLYLIANTLVNPGDRVLAENPTFENVVSVFRGLRANLEPLNLDENGAIIPLLKDLDSKPKVVHLTPSCQYPLGYQMSFERKKQWIEFAQKNNTYLIENDYEHEIVNYKQQSSTLFSQDFQGNTIYLSTFNRLLHPSIRIGFMIVPFKILPAVKAIMNHSHRFVPPSIQMVLNDFIKQSFLQVHIKNIWQTSHERKATFLKAAQQYLPNWEMKDTAALHLLGYFNQSPINNSEFDDVAFSELLSDQNIAVQSLSRLYFNEPVKNGLVLGYSSVPSSVILQKLQQWSLLY